MHLIPAVSHSARKIDNRIYSPEESAGLPPPTPERRQLLHQRAVAHAFGFLLEVSGCEDRLAGFALPGEDGAGGSVSVAEVGTCPGCPIIEYYTRKGPGVVVKIVEPVEEGGDGGGGGEREGQGVGMEVVREMVHDLGAVGGEGEG